MTKAAERERLWTEYYQTDRGRYKFSLRDVNEADWVSPSQAEALIKAAKAQPPGGVREHLAWKAAHGSLATKATEIVEVYDSDELACRNVPLDEEWGRPDWSNPFADLWIDGEMSIVASGSEVGKVTKFVGIQLSRQGVQRIAELFSGSYLNGASTNTTVAPRRGKPQQYDREGFKDEVMTQLDYHGGFMVGEWDRSDLTDHMFAWMTAKKWVKVPERTWVTDRIKEAVAQFETAKSAN